MQSAIENQLGLKNVKILRGNSLDSDHGKLFVKYGDEDLVRGEFESLKAIQETDTIFCPKAFGVVEKEGSHALITSFIEFEHGKDWAKAGNLLARMHMKNAENVADGEKGRQFVGGGSHRIRRMTMPMSESESEDSEPENEEENENFCTKKFGFKVPTCCGRLPQENAWLDSWAVCSPPIDAPEAKKIIEKCSGQRKLKHGRI
uniref:protein-ribulosamine 3-kinase n=1 Tax=Caenorhabditis japonica TaxID=281687 RepID=A0A8R1DUU8_CAEJA